MDIAVSHRTPPSPACGGGKQGSTPAAARRVAELARVEVFEDMVAAEPFWRRLEDGHSLLTPYQRFDLLAAWQRHVGACSGVTPFIVTGFDHAGEPLFLWPFGRSPKGALGIVRFLGSKHANFNMGLWRRDMLAAITASDLHHIFNRIAGVGAGIDLVALFFQPLHWDGTVNPFSLLPHQASVDMSTQLNLRGMQSGIGHVLSSSMRSRLRGKERKLQSLAGYRYLQATTAEDVNRLLDSFFALKSAHMAAQGLGNVFAEEGVAEFLREASHCKLANGRPLIEIHALEGGGEVLALFGTIVDDYRFSSMFNTYTLGDNARHSPGLILLTHMVNGAAARGVGSFDIGVGRASYKSFFCREPEPLFDTFLPLSSRGRLAALAFGTVFAGKRIIKQNPTLWSAVQTLRRVRARV
jgi:CelD/BcsL family acetyltransferase involved in cellulose biosynthesis